MLRAPWWGLRTSCRHFSTRQGAQEVLVRDWIRSSLYQQKTGYFQQDVINTLPEPLAFKSMVAESDYRKAVAKVRDCSAFIRLKKKHVQHWQISRCDVVLQAYEDKPLAWMTPAETFAPHYSNAIGAYILSKHRRRGGARR
jgi:hypothetical protein